MRPHIISPLHGTIRCRLRWYLIAGVNHCSEDPVYPSYRPTPAACSSGVWCPGVAAALTARRSGGRQAWIGAGRTGRARPGSAERQCR